MMGRKYSVILGIFLIAIGLWSITENILKYKSITGILWISNITAVIIGLALITKDKKLLAFSCFMAIFPIYSFFREITVRYGDLRWLLVHTVAPIIGISLLIKSRKITGKAFSYRELIPAFIFVAAIEIISFFASTPGQNINFSHDARIMPYLVLMGIAWFFIALYINNKQK